MGAVVYFVSIDTNLVFVSPLLYRSQDTMFLMEADNTLALKVPTFSYIETGRFVFCGVVFLVD